MAIANNLKRAKLVMQPQKGKTRPAGVSDKGGIGKRTPAGLSSKIAPNNKSNPSIRQQNYDMSKGARKTNNSNA